METLFKINKWGIIITLLLYLTIWGGILSQILLGLVQVICYCYILFYRDSLEKQHKTHLWVYGILASFLIIGTVISPDIFVWVLWLGSIPLVFYFLFITHMLKLKQ